MFCNTLYGLVAVCLLKAIAGIDDNTGHEIQMAQIKAIVCALVTKGIPIDVLDKTTIHGLRKYGIDLEKMSEDEIKSMCDSVNIKQGNQRSGTEPSEKSQINTDSNQNIELSGHETNTESEIDEEKNKNTNEQENRNNHSSKLHNIITSSFFIALNNGINRQNGTSHLVDSSRAEEQSDTLRKKISSYNNQEKSAENYEKSNELANIILKLIDSKSNRGSKIPIDNTRKLRNSLDNILYNPPTISEERPKINVIIIKDNDYFRPRTTEYAPEMTKAPTKCKSSYNCNFGEMEKLIQETFQKLLKDAAIKMSAKDENNIRSKIHNSENRYETKISNENNNLENQYSGKTITQKIVARRVNEMRKNNMKINNVGHENSNSVELTNNYWNNRGRQGAVSKINDKVDFQDSKDFQSVETKLDKRHLPRKKYERSSYQKIDKAIAEMKRAYLARNSEKQINRGELNDDYSFGQNLGTEEEKMENNGDEDEKKYGLDVVLEKYKHQHQFKDTLEEKTIRNKFLKNQKKLVEDITADNNSLNVTGLNILNEIKVLILNEIKKDINVSRVTDVIRKGSDLSNTTPETTEPTTKSIPTITLNTSSLIGTLKQDILNTMKLYLSNASYLLGNVKNQSPMTYKPYNQYEMIINGNVSHNMPCMESTNSDMPYPDMTSNYFQDENQNYPIQANPHMQLYNEPNQHLELSINKNKEIPETNFDTLPQMSSQSMKNNEMVPLPYDENTNEWNKQDLNTNNLKHNTKQMDNNSRYLWGHLNPEVYRRNQLSIKNIKMESAHNTDQHPGMPIEGFIKTQEKLNSMLEKFLASQNGLKKDDDSIEIF